MRTLVEQADAVATRKVSAVELVTRALELIERVEDATNAFTTVLPDDALDRARQLDHERLVGPLHGVPVVVKDLYDVAGIATSGCCAAFDDRMATWDSAVVERLRAAGAIIVAKTNQHELAFGTNSQLSSFGPVRNPWDTERSPGGSSGGSATAVATGVVALAMGSDTGGSIRIPASLCGVTGLKPTHGAVSLRGIMPLAPSFDTAGPLAASAADCSLVHGIICAYDPADLRSRRSLGSQTFTSVDGIRIGLPSPWFASIQSAVNTGVREAADVLSTSGATVEEFDGVDVEGTRERVGALLVAEASYAFASIADDHRVTPETRGLLQVGTQIDAHDYLAAHEAALVLRRSFDEALAHYDALLVPAMPFVAPRVSDERIEVEGGYLSNDSLGATRCTLAVNAAGLPAIAFPVGSADGLPIGAQLIGREWSEPMLCAVAEVYQRATDWHVRTAPV